MALLKALCWALIFIIRIRFPTGTSLAKKTFNLMYNYCIKQNIDKMYLLLFLVIIYSPYISLFFPAVLCGEPYNSFYFPTSFRRFRGVVVDRSFTVLCCREIRSDCQLYVPSKSSKFCGIFMLQSNENKCRMNVDES